MTPIEKAAKAYWNDCTDEKSMQWDDAPEYIKDPVRSGMRAALESLMDWEPKKSGGELWDEINAAKWRTWLRELLEQTDDKA